MAKAKATTEGANPTGRVELKLVMIVGDDTRGNAQTWARLDTMLEKCSNQGGTVPKAVSEWIAANPRPDAESVEVPVEVADELE